MKKILISFFIALLFIFDTYSYNPTNKDKTLIDNISSKIEKVIENKGEKYRDIFIDRLGEIKNKTNNKRLIFIVDEIINNISNIENVFGGLFDDLDSDEQFSNNKWTGFAYPYGISNESSWKIKGGFKSLEECRNWIDNILPNNSVADYECGKNCKYNSFYGVNICEETVK